MFLASGRFQVFLHGVRSCVVVDAIYLRDAVRMSINRHVKCLSGVKVIVLTLISLNESVASHWRK
jgi:hypothetical protein